MLAAAARDSPGADSPARLQSCDPSAHSDSAGRSDELGRGSPQLDGQKAQASGLASLITSRGVVSSPSALRPAAGAGSTSHHHADGEA